jgi:hypothetical protein
VMLAMTAAFTFVAFRISSKWVHYN